jgi:hypothetical protein
MDAGRLGFSGACFDLVLNRHASVYAAKIVGVLRPSGVFITQQVGGRNTQSIFTVFGWESNAAQWQAHFTAPGAPPMPDSVPGFSALQAAFTRLGCATRSAAKYDVRYWLSGPCLVRLLPQGRPAARAVRPARALARGQPRDLGLRLPARRPGQREPLSAHRGETGYLTASP